MPDITYTQLQKAITALGKSITRGMEETRAQAQHIDAEATDTARIAEMIAAMGVDPETVGDTRELGKITAGLSQALIAYASASDTTAKTAKAAHDQAHASHAGIREAVSRSPVDVSNLKREWLKQD